MQTGAAYQFFYLHLQFIEHRAGSMKKQGVLPHLK